MDIELQSGNSFDFRDISSDRMDTDRNEKEVAQNAFVHRQEKQKGKEKIKSSTLSTICKILKAAIGTGVLAMPQGFSYVYTKGAFMILLLGLGLQYYSWLVLVKAMEERTRQVAEKKETIKKMKKKNIENDEDGYELDEPDQTRQETEEEQENKISEIQPEPQKPGPTTRVITIKMIKEEIHNEELRKKQEKEAKKLKKKKEKEEKQRLQRIQLKQNYKDFSIYDLIRTEFKENKQILIFLQITTLIQMFGSNVSYVIFFKQTLENINPIFKLYWVHLLESIVLILVILSFSFYKRLESLRWHTMVGSYLSLTILYFIVSLCLFQVKLNVDGVASQEPNFLENYPDELEYDGGINWRRVPQFFGVALFAYDINAVITVVRQEMEFSYKFPSVLFFSMLIEFSIYAFIGTIGKGYLAYGQYTADIITTNVGITIEDVGLGLTVFYGVIQILYSVSLLISVLLLNIVAFKILTEMFYGLSFNEIYTPLNVKLLIRLPYISLIVLCATFFNQFTIVISLLGSVTTVILGFILPYALYIKFLRAKSGLNVFFLNTIVLLFGISGGVLGVIFTFVR